MMRGLTFWRPWDWAILHLPLERAKRIENRPVRPPRNVLGELVALHAGKTWHASGAQAIADLVGIEPPTDGPFMAIVGVFRPISIVPFTCDDPWYMGSVVDGHLNVGILIDDVVPLQSPIPCRGMQGWWTLPGDIEEKVRAQLQGDPHGPR